MTYLPDYNVLVNQAIKEFLPRAGEMLQLRAKSKLGVYQAGWPPLAASTLRRKRGRIGKVSRRMGRILARRGLTFASVFGADMPLIRTGRMRASIRHFEQADETHLTANFPMGQHEQDPQITPFIPPGQPLPARPVLGPTLDEMLDPMTEQLEGFVAGRL